MLNVSARNDLTRNARNRSGVRLNWVERYASWPPTVSPTSIPSRVLHLGKQPLYGRRLDEETNYKAPENLTLTVALPELFTS